MKLAFNLEVREEKEYFLSEEDTKKVMDKAFELAKEKYYSGNEDCLYYYIKLALRFLLMDNEIEVVFVDSEQDDEITSIWKKEE